MDKTTTLPTSIPEPLPEVSPRWGLGLTDVLLLGVITVWGTNFVVIKRTFLDLSPYTVNAIRYSIASVLLLFIMLRRPQTRPLQRTDVWRVVVAGISTCGIGQIFMMLGLALSSASQVALLTATMPIFVVLLSHLVGTEHLSRRGWVGVSICFTGIALVVGAPGGANRMQAMIGGFLNLAAALGWAIAMVITTPVLRRTSASLVTAVQVLTGTLILIITAVPAMVREEWSGVTLFTWAGLVFSGAFSLVIATTIWNRGVRIIGPSRTAIYSNLTPVVAAVAGWLILSERFTLAQFVGAAIVLSGLYLVRTAQVK